LLDFVSLVALACTSKYFLAETRMTRALRMTDSPPERMPKLSTFADVFEALNKGVTHVGFLADRFKRRGLLSEPILSGLYSAVLNNRPDACAQIMRAWPSSLWKGGKDWNFIVERDIEAGNQKRLEWILTTFEPRLEGTFCLPKNRASHTLATKATCYDYVKAYIKRNKE
jgi:hypothetical protein